MILHKPSQVKLISVIIPSYNHSDYILATLKSVFNQNISQSLYEVIVVDDGSKDGSVDLLKRMQSVWPFKLITQPNKGVSAALNEGVRCSKGSYIALLASDDLWEIDKLSMQLRALNENPTSRFCFTNGSVFGGRVRSKYKPLVFTGRVKNYIPLINFVPSSSMLFHRSLFDEIGGFSAGVALEDWDFLIKSACVTDFVCVNQPLVRYRVHDLSTMKRLRSDSVMLKKKLEVLRKNRYLISWPVFCSSVVVHRLYEFLRRLSMSFSSK